MKLITNKENFYLPYEVMISLKRSGKLELGISNELAKNLAERGFGSKKTTTSKAYFFWLSCSLAIVIYSIYLSFTEKWWSFIVGYLIAGAIYNVNKKSTAENYLEAALRDEGLYNSILIAGGWKYQIKDEEIPNLQEYYRKRK